MTEKSSTMNTRHQAIEEVVKRHEEREKVLQTAVSNMEKEMVLRQQAGECHKRKAVEIGQQYQELMFNSETLTKQFDEVIKSTFLVD